MDGWVECSSILCIAMSYNPNTDLDKKNPHYITCTFTFQPCCICRVSCSYLPVTVRLLSALCVNVLRAADIWTSFLVNVLGPIRLILILIPTVHLADIFTVTFDDSFRD